MLKVGVAQAGSKMFDTPGSLERAERLCRGATTAGAKLIVLPEGMLGGYPKGLSFGAVVGYRPPAGHELFRRYMESAIRIPGPECEHLAALSRELDLHIVTGAIERDGGTLYCVALLFTPERGLSHKHRKLMPTAMERLVWGMGDGSDMQVVSTAIGRIGMAICWENYMPLYRQHLYTQGVELWCAPTVDHREMWRTSMRHIAYEGRCFVLSSCQRLTPADWPQDFALPAELGQPGIIEGHGVIATPKGDLLTPEESPAELLFAELDMNDIPRGKFDLDVAGHYNRPDVFQFTGREG